jgi:integrase
VQKFLDLYPNAYTTENYRQSLKHFFRSVYGRGDVDAQGDRYFTEDRDMEADLNAFLNYLNGKPPKTIRLRVAAVKSFLMENGVELSQRFWKRLRGRVKGSRARTVDRVPSNVQLRRIMTHLPVNGKALFLVLASSGMRIGEVLQLTPTDVDLNATPAKVTIRGEYAKSGNPRIAFISREATLAVEEWLKTRDDYLAVAVARRHKYAKDPDDPRLFPFQGCGTGHWTKRASTAETRARTYARSTRMCYASSSGRGWARLSQ